MNFNSQNQVLRQEFSSAFARNLKEKLEDTGFDVNDSFTVLDFGCGNGCSTIELYKHFEYSR